MSPDLDEQEVLARAVGCWEDREVDSAEYVDSLRSGRRLDDVRFVQQVPVTQERADD